MVIRLFTRLIFPVVLVSALGCAQAPETDPLVAKAREIHERVLTIDTHDDIPFNFATKEVDPGVRGDRQLDLPKMREGGLDVGFFIVYVGQTRRTPENYEKAKKDAMTKFDAIHRMANEMYPDEIEIAYSADDIERIHATGKLVACIGIENGYVIGKDLSLLEKYYNLGARYITLAHGGHNDISDSSTPREHLGDAETEHGGISEFGKQVIAEMNRLGIMVDVSHISKDAMIQACQLSKAPVIASHSSTRALSDVPRNMDDEQLLALKENGGVMQTVALREFVKKMPDEAAETILKLHAELGLPDRPRGGVVRRAVEQLSAANRQRYDAAMAEINRRWPSATVADFVDHIDHAINLIGIDHVAISSDFDGGGGVDGWEDASETFNVTLELVRRGYTEAQIAQIWSGNTLRVLRANEKVAAELQAMASR